MSVIIRLQRLPWSASAADIRAFFAGLSIPEGGVHIVGGRDGDAFIAFASDEDARMAMRQDGRRIQDARIKLLLSSKLEMQRVIDKAKGELLQPPSATTSADSLNDSASPPLSPDKAVPAAVSGFASFPDRAADPWVLHSQPASAAVPKPDPWNTASAASATGSSPWDPKPVINSFSSNPFASTKRKSDASIAAEILEREGLESPEPATYTASAVRSQPSASAYQAPPPPRDPRRDPFTAYPARMSESAAQKEYVPPVAPLRYQTPNAIVNNSATNADFNRPVPSATDSSGLFRNPAKVADPSPAWGDRNAQKRPLDQYSAPGEEPPASRRAYDPFGGAADNSRVPADDRRFPDMSRPPPQAAAPVPPTFPAQPPAAPIDRRGFLAKPKEPERATFDYGHGQLPDRAAATAPAFDRPAEPSRPKLGGAYASDKQQLPSPGGTGFPLPPPASFNPVQLPPAPPMPPLPPQPPSMPLVPPPAMPTAPAPPPSSSQAQERRSGRSLLPLPPPQVPPPTPPAPLFGGPTIPPPGFHRNNNQNQSWKPEPTRVLSPTPALGEMWTRPPTGPNGPGESWSNGGGGESWKAAKPPPDPRPSQPPPTRPPSLMSMTTIPPSGPPVAGPVERGGRRGRGFGFAASNPRFGGPRSGRGGIGGGWRGDGGPPPEMLLAAERMRESSRVKNDRPNTRYAIISRLPADLSTKESLLEFFLPVRIGDAENIKMLTGADGTPLGMAYIKFSNIDDCTTALKKDGKFGIRIRPSDGEDFRTTSDGGPAGGGSSRRRSPRRKPKPTCIVTVRHVPLPVTEEEVASFFGRLRPLQLRRAQRTSDEGKAYHWFARFHTPQDAGSAAMAKGEIGGAKVSVRDASEEEMIDYCGREEPAPTSKSKSPQPPPLPTTVVDDSVGREVGPAGRVVSINGLSGDVTAEDILNLFSGFSVLEDSIRLHYNEAGKPSGNCLLALQNDASEAVKKLQGAKLHGKTLQIALAVSSEESS